MGDTNNLFGLVHKLFLLHIALLFQENELPAKAVLLLDSAPGHPANLSEVRTPLDGNVVYMPSNTTSLSQIVDQGVMVNFKASYLCQIFMKMVRVLDRSEIIIKHYGRSIQHVEVH